MCTAVIGSEVDRLEQSFVQISVGSAIGPCSLESGRVARRRIARLCYLATLAV